MSVFKHNCSNFPDNFVCLGSFRSSRMRFVVYWHFLVLEMRKLLTWLLPKYISYELFKVIYYSFYWTVITKEKKVRKPNAGHTKQPSQETTNRQKYLYDPLRWPCQAHWTQNTFYYHKAGGIFAAEVLPTALLVNFGYTLLHSNSVWNANPFLIKYSYGYNFTAYFDPILCI